MLSNLFGTGTVSRISVAWLQALFLRLKIVLCLREYVSRNINVDLTAPHLLEGKLG
jgi:hypothetical protein